MRPFFKMLYQTKAKLKPKHSALTFAMELSWSQTSLMAGAYLMLLLLIKKLSRRRGKRRQGLNI